jgi:hypothetical protein
MLAAIAREQLRLRSSNGVILEIDVGKQIQGVKIDFFTLIRQLDDEKISRHDDASCPPVKYLRYPFRQL